MPHNQTATILGHLRRLSDADTPDGQLLRRFAAEGDETAFAALLQRHGRLVWGLCRRTLNHHDAEDAFQATFLVLARQAASIRNPEGFVSWLYGVAARIAFRARHNAARRQVVEAQAEATPPASPPAEAGLRELQVILEEEVGRLKTIYRMPFVLCCLEGKSKAEAAAELGWKEGSVSGRLARARERLRQRLARRGVTLPAALTAAALAQPASAAVPVALSHATLAAALSFGALKAAAGSLRAVSLAEGFLASVTVTRLALRTVALLLCALLVGGAGFAASWPRGSSPAETPAPSQPGKERPRQPEVAASLPPGALVRMGSTSLRHGSTVLAVALAPDGKTVAAASIDGRLCVWDTASGALLREWRPDALALAWSPDGKTLATGGNDRAVILWDVATGKQRRQLTGHAKRISALAYTADGSILASASADGIIRLWRPAMGKEIRRLEGHQDPGNIPTRAPNQEPVFPVVGCLAFAPDGKTLASGGTVGTARLWDVATGKEVLGLKGHTQNARRPGFVPAGVAISGVAFAPDGKTLATASYDDNTALLWDVSTGKPRGRLAGHTGGVHSVAFAPDGKTLATGGAFYDGSVWVWDVASGKERARMAGHTHGVYGLDFSKDGRLVASGGADGAVRLWDAATGRETSSGPGHRERINTLVYSPDGKTLATGSHDHTVRLWDAATGKELRCLEGHQHWVNAVAFSPDGKLLASGGYDGTGSVRFWDPVTGRELRRVNVPGGALALSFSPDGGLVAVRDNSFVVHVVETATGGTQRQLKLPPGSTHCVVFSPDGKYLAADSGYAHCVVHLFETATGKEVYQFTGTKENPIYAGTLLFSP